MTAEFNISEPFIWRTQKEICEAIGIPSSTLNKLIKQSTKLLKTVSGKGRNAKTGWTTVSLLMKHVLFSMQQAKMAYTQYIQHIHNDIVQACVASPARIHLAQLVDKLTKRTGDDARSEVLDNSS